MGAEPPEEEATARELESAAARAPAVGESPAPGCELEAMLRRRGLPFELSRPDIPFGRLDQAEEALLAEALGHYGFRLFVRDAILQRVPFRPEELTRYLSPRGAREAADTLVRLRLLRAQADGRYHLTHAARSFGGTLEWYVARQLRRTLGFEVHSGVKFPVSGLGGDLDILACAEGKLVYVELKSSPPKHLTDSELRMFVRRVDALRPELAVFAMDTALRLSDKVMPMLERASGTRSFSVRKGVHALTPHLYVVSARPALMKNLQTAIACGFRALAPPPFSATH